MKNHTTSQFLTILMVMMCSLFALPQRVHAKYPYAYAQLNEKGNTLTFYYDDKAAERPGKKNEPQRRSLNLLDRRAKMGWHLF